LIERATCVGRQVVEHHADALRLGIMDVDEFHALWTRGKTCPYLHFIIFDDPQMTMARLALIQGVVTVLASGLELLGVEAPEEMR
jgi:DALR anticodon binding domain